MEIFKPQRAPFELENPDKRVVNANSFTQIIPLENGRATFDILQQALAGQVIPVSGSPNLVTATINSSSSQLPESTSTTCKAQKDKTGLYFML